MKNYLINSLLVLFFLLHWKADVKANLHTIFEDYNKDIKKTYFDSVKKDKKGGSKETITNLNCELNIYKILVIVANSGAMNQADADIVARLTSSGYIVTVMSHTANLHPTNLTNFDLVFISSTVSPSNLKNKYKSSTKPIIISDRVLLRHMGMTGNTSGTDYGTKSTQKNLNFISSTHPIANGLSGSKLLHIKNESFCWGKPGVQADVIASIVGTNSNAGIFVYENGKQLKDNTIAAGKRGFLWINDNGFASSNSTAKNVFDRMISWGLDVTSQPQPPTPPTNLVATNITSNSFTITWTASTSSVGINGYVLYINGVNWYNTTLTTTSIDISGRPPGSTITITVKAVDNNGVESLLSSPLQVTTLGESIPMESFIERTIIANQSMPWDLTWGPDNKIWYTERWGGKVSRVDISTGTKDVLLNLGSLMVRTSKQDGLLGIAIHPQFNSGKPFVYIAYTYYLDPNDDNNRLTKIVRYSYNFSSQTLGSPVEVLNNIPGSNDHNSGRLDIGPDSKLYYTVGDLGAGQFANFNRVQKAQDLTSLEGKILRLNLEPVAGSWVPLDNPFSNNVGQKTPIYSYGHRNAQGLVWGNVNGIDRLYSSEHGPFSDDEVNLIESGQNYGWPMVIGYCDGNYNGRTTGGYSIVNEENNCTTLNAKEPLISIFAANPPPPLTGVPSFNFPSVGPSGTTFYGSNAIPGWQNSILVATLKNGSIMRMNLNADGTQIIGDVLHYFTGRGRYRDVIVSPDGTKIYVACDSEGNTSGPAEDLVTMPPNPGSILEFQYSPNLMSEYLESRNKENEIGIQTKDTNNSADEVTIYPNPANDFIIVELKDGVSEGPYVLEFIRSNGSIDRRLLLKGNITKIKIDDLSIGLYILRVLDKDRRILSNKKLLKIN